MTLTGKPAIIVIVLIIAFMVGQDFVLRKDVEPQALAKIKLQLQGEYLSKTLPGFQDAVKSGDMDRINEESKKNLAMIKSLKFDEVTLKGFGKKLKLKVKVSVDGKTPPDGRDVRYYIVEHGMITGWTIKREISSFSYFMPL